MDAHEALSIAFDAFLAEAAKSEGGDEPDAPMTPEDREHRDAQIAAQYESYARERTDEDRAIEKAMRARAVRLFADETRACDTCETPCRACTGPED